MKKKFIAFMLVLLLSVPAAVQASGESGEQAVSRGEFFGLIADKLGLAASDSAQELPQDVASGSPYADSVRVLMERKVLFGFPDGTVRPDEPIKADHAAYLLARLMGVEDADAAAFLREKYGVNWSDPLSYEEASQAVARVLDTDPELVSILKQSTEQQLAQKSYRASAEQKMSFAFSEDAPPELAAMLANLSTTMEMEYHQEDGMHIAMTIAVPEGLRGEGEEAPEAFTIEQYLVPEGWFMNMADPLTGEVRWIAMDEELLSLNQLQQTQRFSMEYFDALMSTKSFFYRHEGEKEVNGVPAYQIGFNGKVASYEELLKMLQPFMLDEQSTEQLTEMITEIDGILKGATMAGTMWLDQETLLPVRAEMTMTIQFAENPSLPFTSISAEMTMEFYDYNQVEAIELPPEAEEAEEFSLEFDGGMEEPEETPSEETVDPAQ